MHPLQLQDLLTLLAFIGGVFAAGAGVVQFLVKRSEEKEKEFEEINEHISRVREKQIRAEERINYIDKDLHNNIRSLEEKLNFLQDQLTKMNSELDEVSEVSGVFSISEYVTTDQLDKELQSIRHELDSIKNEFTYNLGNLGTELKLRFKSIDDNFNTVNSKISKLEDDIGSLSNATSAIKATLEYIKDKLD